MRYICVEGCLGIGKTTVAKLLSTQVEDSTLLLEDFEHHPFLDDFYKNSKYTFETEISFLLIHYHQLLKTVESNPSILIGDYSLFKDTLFADANLSSAVEHGIFMDLYNYLITKVVRPEVIICLSGSDELIYNRIIQRDRSSEQGIRFEYIQKINSHYTRLFDSFKKQGIKTVDIDMNKNDYVRNPELIDVLINNIDGFVN